MKRCGALLMLLVLSSPALAGSTGDARPPGLAPKLHFDPFERPELLSRPPPAVLENTEPAAPPMWQPRLRAVMVAGRASVANVEGQLVGIGEELDGHRLVEVTERRAVFEKDGTLYELVMQ